MNSDITPQPATQQPSQPASQPVGQSAAPMRPEKNVPGRSGNTLAYVAILVIVILIIGYYFVAMHHAGSSGPIGNMTSQVTTAMVSTTSVAVQGAGNASASGQAALLFKESLPLFYDSATGMVYVEVVNLSAQTESLYSVSSAGSSARLLNITQQPQVTGSLVVYNPITKVMHYGYIMIAPNNSVSQLSIQNSTQYEVVTFDKYDNYTYINNAGAFEALNASNKVVATVASPSNSVPLTYVYEVLADPYNHMQYGRALSYGGSPSTATLVAIANNNTAVATNASFTFGPSADFGLVFDAANDNIYYSIINTTTASGEASVFVINPSNKLVKTFQIKDFSDGYDALGGRMIYNPINKDIYLISYNKKNATAYVISQNNTLSSFIVYNNSDIPNASVSSAFASTIYDNATGNIYLYVNELYNQNQSLLYSVNPSNKITNLSAYLNVDRGGNLGGIGQPILYSNTTGDVYICRNRHLIILNSTGGLQNTVELRGMCSYLVVGPQGNVYIDAANYTGTTPSIDLYLVKG